ncbi:MAG: hypothetical protein OEQ25_18875, partial [Gammaproteobacteria bacterium]|nr:hypothetical protein [Gammaproteobacteria bacterium]
ESRFADSVVAAAARAPDQADALAELIGPLTSQVDSNLESAAADHWWVEARIDNGWSTLDLLLSGPLADMRPEPLERFKPGSLPESLYHQVTIRVVIEQWDDGATIEQVPLEHTLRAAEAIYHDFELLFAPYHFEPAPAGSTAVAEATSIVDTAQEWLPVLRHGNEVIRQLGFDRHGNLEGNPGRVAVARKAEAATSALQALGSEPEKHSAQLTALWLEYRVDVPGRTTQIVRREIFDLPGPAGRTSTSFPASILNSAAFRERGRSLLGVHRILVTSAALPQVALERAGLELWAKQGPQIAAIARLVSGSDDQEVEHRAYREPFAALDLLTLATARHQLSPHSASIYLARPNILSTHFTVEIGEDLSVSKAFDIVVNDVGVTANGSVPAARIRLEQGVLDTILEAELVDAEQRIGNTADLFALRDGAPDGWQRIEPESSELQLHPTAQSRIANALAAGRIVVAPTRLDENVEPAWWEMDPVTGTTLGIGINGWGAVAEETVRQVSMQGFLQGAKKHGIRVSCKALTAFLKSRQKIVILFGPPSTSLYFPEAVLWLSRLGCSIVV